MSSYSTFIITSSLEYGLRNGKEDIVCVMKEQKRKYEKQKEVSVYIICDVVIRNGEK